MRISAYAIAFGLSFAAVIVGPTIPSEWMSNFWHTPSAVGVKQITNNIGRTLSMAAFADETDTQPIDFDNLIRMNGRELQISTDETVSMDVLFTSQIKKIGYGHVKTVNIVRTPTGTYSSDALVSPHVLYPGVKVSEVLPALTTNSLSLISGLGWTKLQTNKAGSTISFGRDGTYVVN